MRLRISARKSDLARLQAYTVGAALQAIGTYEIDYRFKESLGDINLTEPLWKIPQKGVFTEDFNQELLKGETDMVVHSWKDLPTEIKNETEIAATLPRADQRDLLLVKKKHFAQIASRQKITIYSSSPRRSYNLTVFLKEALPFSVQSVQFESVRGNIPTRIRKLLESQNADGLIVAKAALDRLLTAPQAEFFDVQKTLCEYLSELNWMVLPLSVNPNAAAQGALAVEILKSRTDLKDLLSHINHTETYECAQQERQILASFGGGCHQKIGIAILKRPFGNIQILKGLTISGQVLDQHEILKECKNKFYAAEMWPSENQLVHAFKRQPLPLTQLPPEINALYVSKAEAWPENFVFSKYVWTAGLASWKKLAQKGIWVHGCSEELGEQEDSRIDILASGKAEKLCWFKLSHSQAVAPMAATYELIPTGEDFQFAGKKSFYWSSGSLFQEAFKHHPEIAQANHACGPGHTFQIISDILRKNLGHDGTLEIFLNQKEWRLKCQI